MPRDLERLTATHHRIMDMHLAGVRVCDIARELEMTEKSVSRICSAPAFQEIAARRRAASETLAADLQVVGACKAREVLDGAATDAATAIVRLLDSDNEGVRLKAAESVLDRTIGASGDANGKVVLTALMLKGLQAALRESAAGRVEVLDVEPEVVAQAVEVHKGGAA